MLSEAATIFTVHDIAASTAFYREGLGFTVSFEYGDPIFYVCLCRDGVSLHLVAENKTPRLPGNGAVCVFVKDVDALYAELISRGVSVLKPPKDYAYGMREFDLLDPDGNYLTFGMSSGSQIQQSASTSQ